MRKVLSVLGWVFTGLFCALLLLFAFGGFYNTVAVSGSSMLPTYENGDLLLIERADTYAVGEVIVY